MGSYRSLTLFAPAVAEATRPGQFVSLAVEARHTLLSRPFSVSSVHGDRQGTGTLEVVFDVIGAGTRWLSDRRPGDLVELVGPLGRPFPLPERPAGCVLVGGGYGAAPLLYLAHVLSERGHRADMVLGAATQARLFNPIEAKRLSSTAVFTTDDGSFGTRGRVTDVLAQVVQGAGSSVLYACGPMPMLAAVARAAAQLQVPCHVAVEESMACGVGVCWTCVVPVHGPDGMVHQRACMEGPVFDGARVDWERIAPPSLVDAELAP